jgi:hypothetical protein
MKQRRKETKTEGSLTSPAGKVLARAFDLSANLATATVYSIPERQRIVEQLQLVLRYFYVHLERKKSIYGFDPVRALDLMAGSIETLSDSEFHQSIAQLITRVRDRHLAFYGKTPFGISASLGFLIERCWDGEDVRYVVTKIDRKLTPKPKRLQPGAFVSHWNGVPIERFVRLNANFFDGGNEAASLARSLAYLTTRPLNQFGPPLEEWVDLRFELKGITSEERFIWKGFDATQAPLTPSLGRNMVGFGGDFNLLQLQHARRVQFVPQSFDAPAAPTGVARELGVPDIIGQDLNNGQLEYGSVTTEHGKFAYLRLWGFHVDNVDDVLHAFVAAFPNLPRNGLILDIRGNTGGYIAAGERLLQLFTPRRITPARFQFRVTPATRTMAGATSDFRAWSQAFKEAFATGELYTQGYPIEGTDDDANKVGQRYFGPVVIVTDALAFSTADIVVAGFIDHEIGQVICLDKNTAAAGGNNWPWPILRLLNPDFTLDPKLKPQFDKGILSPDVYDAFNREGVSLSDKATLYADGSDSDGLIWQIKDGTVSQIVRYAPDLNDSLLVYLDQGRHGLADLPVGVKVSFTIRRCVRTGRNEGKLLEDLGIEPSVGIEPNVVVYPMTLRDIMEENQDLITRASLELTRMPLYDLKIEVLPEGGEYRLSCQTVNLASVEVYSDQRYLAGGPASNEVPTAIAVPGGFHSVVVKGLKDDAIVARAIINLPK